MAVSLGLGTFRTSGVPSCSGKASAAQSREITQLFHNNCARCPRVGECSLEPQPTSLQVTLLNSLPSTQVLSSSKSSERGNPTVCPHDVERASAQGRARNRRSRVPLRGEGHFRTIEKFDPHPTYFLVASGHPEPRHARHRDHLRGRMCTSSHRSGARCSHIRSSHIPG
jgi:hypothetical protein